jgi:hypothetical protein
LRSLPLNLISTVGRPRRAMDCSFCQGFYLTERAAATEIPDSRTSSMEQADSTLGEGGTDGWPG